MLVGERRHSSNSSSMMKRAILNVPTRRLRVGLVLGAALGLASCGGTSFSDTTGAVTSMLNMGAGPSAPEPAPAEPVADRACPRLYVLPETEVLRREASGGGNDNLMWQASITKTARECAPAATGVTVRVGVAGRLIRGPKGGSGALTLPLRVAVREGNATSYSKLHSVRVTLDQSSQDWAYVDEAVVIQAPSTAQIFVGFDQN